MGVGGTRTDRTVGYGISISIYHENDPPIVC